MPQSQGGIITPLFSDKAVLARAASLARIGRDRGAGADQRHRHPDGGGEPPGGNGVAPANPGAADRDPHYDAEGYKHDRGAGEHPDDPTVIDPGADFHAGARQARASYSGSIEKVSGKPAARARLWALPTRYLASS